MSAAYKAVIQAVAEKSYNAEAMVLLLGQRNPSLFVKLMDDTRLASDIPDWYKEVYDYLIGGTKVNAIRTIRENTKFGLKEAMDMTWYVVRNSPRLKDIFPEANKEVDLSSIQLEMADKLIRAFKSF